jgi:hypothetical protein
MLTNYMNNKELFNASIARDRVNVHGLLIGLELAPCKESEGNDIGRIRSRRRTRSNKKEETRGNKAQLTLAALELLLELLEVLLPRVYAGPARHRPWQRPDLLVHLLGEDATLLGHRLPLVRLGGGFSLWSTSIISPSGPPPSSMPARPVAVYGGGADLLPRLRGEPACRCADGDGGSEAAAALASGRAGGSGASERAGRKERRRRGVAARGDWGRGGRGDWARVSPGSPFIRRGERRSDDRDSL